jgi:hypothetical protein
LWGEGYYDWSFSQLGVMGRGPVASISHRKKRFLALPYDLLIV